MIQHPAIIALIINSFVTSGLLLYAGWYGVRILTRWDGQSGSELQLGLEQRTYLISTIVGYALAFQVLSLFLYIFTADNLHHLFVGAMCAAGTLNANSFGYPALIVKIINCVLAGVWLIINQTDTRGYDYPLIKVKYGLLMLLVPMLFLETVLQFSFFSGLRADVITSCCGSLFSTDKRSLAGDLAGLPVVPMEALFFGGMALTVLCGIYFYRSGKAGYLFSFVSVATFVIAAASLVSFICLYFYELPTHHCPFCILQKEYGYVGYPLFATLLTGGITGAGCGALMPFRGRPSLSRVIPPIQRTLTLLTIACYLLFTLIVSYRMVTTSFRLS